MKEEVKKDYIIYRRERAFVTIKEVEMLLENNNLALAMNRIYYGCFYIAGSLCLFDNFSTSKHNSLLVIKIKIIFIMRLLKKKLVFY